MNPLARPSRPSTQPGAAHVALTAASLTLAFAATTAHARVWGTTENACYAAGYNTSTRATGGEYEGLWRCTNTTGFPDPDIDDDLFTMDVLTDINAFINSVPDFDSTSIDIGAFTYLLESADEAAGRIITVSAEGLVAGSFAEAPIPGGLETTDINIDGSGAAGGGRYHLYSGALTSGPWCDYDVDGDGDTDVFDFSILASLFGQAVPPATVPDFDGDGVVTVFDFAAFVEDFGCEP